MQSDILIIILFISILNRNVQVTISGDGIPQYEISDINLRQHFYTKNIIEDSLKRANVLKINNDEIKIAANLYDREKVD